MILEACVDRVESAMIATENGADRLELCSNLIIGGTSPTMAMFKEVRKVCNTDIRVLIRPRFGDFLYTNYEFNIIKEEVRQFKEEGADGVVIGILKPDGSLDEERMSELIAEAGDLKITLHRAFDVCVNPYLTLESCVRLGIDTILTSGQEESAVKGLSLLKELNKKAGNRIHLMAGSGVSASVIKEIFGETGIKNYHLSGKSVLQSKMVYRKEGVPMGLPNFSEYEIWETDGEKIRQAKEVLKSLSND